MIGSLVLSGSAVISLLLGLSIVVAAIILVVRMELVHWLILALIAWTLVESVALKFVPTDWYTAFRYGGEALIYALCIASVFVAYKEHRLFRYPMRRLWIGVGVLIAIGVLSLLINQYSVFDWVLGMRQVFRYAVLAAMIYWFGFTHHIRKWLFVGVLGICLLQALFGLVQYASGGRLDALLLAPSDVTIGNVAVISGVDERWIRGDRIFGTLGRYDRFGAVMAVALIMTMALWYHGPKQYQKTWVLFAMIVFTLALILSVSRASWLMAIGGVSMIAFGLQRDKQALKVAMIGGSIVAVYLFMFILQPGSVKSIVETPDQTIAERIFEAVSPTAIRESYYGFGRIFFIVHTPLTVVPSAPLFGVGPGRYGGGVATARLNTDVYDALALPFGIEGRFGQIDNSWFSLWGEFGTLGLMTILYLGVRVMRYAQEQLNSHASMLHNTILTGTIGLISGLGIVGFFGPYFELRGLMVVSFSLVGLALIEYDIRSRPLRPNYLDR